MRDFQNREILVFLALTKMDVFQNCALSYKEDNVSELNLFHPHKILVPTNQFPFHELWVLYIQMITKKTEEL